MKRHLLYASLLTAGVLCASQGMAQDQVVTLTTAKANGEKVTLRVNQLKKGVTVDWGDGTTPDTLTGTSTATVKWTPTHNYAAPGDYVIALTVNGTFGIVWDSSGMSLLGYTSGSDNRNYAYRNAIQRVFLGSGITSIGDYAFFSCYSLTQITIPSGVTSIGQSAFQSCGCLASITIPSGVTSIGDYAFYGCDCLASVTLPSVVTSIGQSAFGYCYSVAFYDFTVCTAVPTLSDANAFTDIPADCEIRVPAALLDEWKAATNWATYANQIVGV